MGALILKKLGEGSTWAGLGALVAGLGFPHADQIGHLIPSIGVVVAGVLAIVFP
jgi:hypothetical protein